MKGYDLTTEINSDYFKEDIDEVVKTRQATLDDSDAESAEKYDY